MEATSEKVRPGAFQLVDPPENRPLNGQPPGLPCAPPTCQRGRV